MFTYSNNSYLYYPNLNILTEYLDLRTMQNTTIAISNWCYRLFKNCSIILHRLEV